MGVIFAILIIFALYFLFFFSLFTLAVPVLAWILIAGLSGYGLYKVIGLFFEEYTSRFLKENRSTSSDSNDWLDPLELIIFGDMSDDRSRDDD